MPSPSSAAAFSSAAWTSVSDHCEQLRQLPLGGRCTLSGTRLTKVQRDRNHVFHVLSPDAREYFLKIRDSPQLDPQERSAAGLALATVALETEPLAQLPAFAQVWPDRFELVSRLPGMPLNRYLYGGFLADGPWRFAGTFFGLGRSLARLHQYLAVGPLAAGTDRRTDLTVLGLDSSSELPLLAQARQVAARWASGPLPVRFVHGNLAFTNVLCHRGRVGLIDFENCGSGFCADDLSRLLQHFRCLELTGGPWVLLTERAVRSLLNGYSTLHAVDTAALGDWMYLHLAQFYQTRFVRHESSRRVARRPVHRERLERALVEGPEQCRRWVAARWGCDRA